MGFLETLAGRLLNMATTLQPLFSLPGIELPVIPAIVLDVTEVPAKANVGRFVRDTVSTLHSSWNTFMARGSSTASLVGE